MLLRDEHTEYTCHDGLAGRTSSLFNVVNMVLQGALLVLCSAGCCTPSWRGLPSPINLEEIIELRLVIATAAGAIYLLDSSLGSKSDLIGSQPYHGAILEVEIVDISSPVGVEFVPFQDQGRVLGNCWPGDSVKG